MKWTLYLLVLVSGYACLSGEIIIKPDSQPTGSATLSKKELNRKESKDFIKKCLTLNNFAEATLEYEARMKEKFPGEYKTKIFMDAAAATSKYDKKYLLREFGEEPYISVETFLNMFSLLCRLDDYEQQGDVIMIKKADDEIVNRPEGRYKIEWVNELPEEIFTIEDKFLIAETQSDPVIVIEGRQFKDCDSAFNYITGQPSSRFKDGILFRYKSKATSDLSEALFDKVRIWTRAHDLAFYYYLPFSSRKPGVFIQYVPLPLSPIQK